MVQISRKSKDEKLPKRLLKVKLKNRKKRRINRKEILSKLKVFGTNANGIMSKKESFRNLLNTDSPDVFMIQETKLAKKNQLQLEDYEILEQVRKKKKGGGGIMIGIKKDVQTIPVDASPQDDEVEILVMEVQLKDMTVRFLTGYGPQEDDEEDKINKFYCTLEEEIVACEERECGLIIELDCNAKLGKNIIEGDPHDMSNNGKLLWDIVQRRNCVVVNSTKKCHGSITRSRMKSGVKEESILDYVIVNPLIAPFVEEMNIDESKAKALTRFLKGRTIPSDHNYLSCSFNIPLHRRSKPRQEIYRLRNKTDLQKFKDHTTNTTKFTKCFTVNGDVQKEGKLWLKTLKSTIHRCFKKVRITQKKKDDIQEKLDLRRQLKNDINQAKSPVERHNLEDRLQETEEEISALCEAKNYEKIKSQLQTISNKDGTTNCRGIWRLRRKIFPKPREQLSGKKDANGRLITNPERLKEIYIDGYIERLKHREMNPGLLKLKALREELFQQRLHLSKLNKSPEWTMEDLDKVLLNLKDNKAVDPVGLVNELFSSKNIGTDLKKSVLILMNKIKASFREPEFMTMANITSFWKGKGSKDEIDNERGIFILIILRMIKDKLIHNDIKKVITMSDSQVGARTEFSLRNHLFIIYSCLNSANKNESPPIDLHMYDLTKCFDGLWLEECCNNLYESGVIDDKLALIYEGNRTNEVAVKTPGGLTARKTVKRIVTQGGVTGPVCCAVQTDKMGKESMENKEYLYMYKGKVGIPTLAMIDDIAKVSVCGTPAVADNAFINARIEQTKQLFNGGKCHALHAGRQLRSCCILKAHNTDIEIVDKEKYVGDVVTSDGKHTKNVESRRSKGMGVISEITSILDGLCLGSHYFTSALMMRQTMLVTVLLSNAETWLRLTKKDLGRLERIDRMFLRRIFQIPNSVPISFMYLETGCAPIEYIIKMKRIMYLHHILTREDDALIARAFWAQVDQPVKGDWCLVVREDLEAIGLGEMSYQEIRNMNTEALRLLVKIKIKETAYQVLLCEKEKCSKLKSLSYSCLRLQPYLSTESQLTNKQKRVLFRWRCHSINVKRNIGIKDAKCPLCLEADDTQYHLLTCAKLSTPPPWNIESVVQALRQREIILEKEKRRQKNGKEKLEEK